MDCHIDPHSRWWNTHLIDLCFYPPEAKLIKSLPLCSTVQPNTLVWLKENSGNYSVKTGYKFLCETPDVDLVNSEEAMAQRKFWKSIWNLRVPGKIKHFLWKCCTNSLSTRENLFKKTILIDSLCHLCSRESESVLHAIWGCEKVQQVWIVDFGWWIGLQQHQVPSQS